MKNSACTLAVLSALSSIAMAGSPPPQNKLPGAVRVPSTGKHVVDRVLPVAEEADDLNPGIGEATSTGAAVPALPMTFHGGKVLASTTQVRLIFAGPNWATATFAGTKITGLAKFFGSYSNTPYAKTASEYTGSNGKVSALFGYQGYKAPAATSVTLDGRNINSVVTAACTEYRSGTFKADTSGNQYIVAYTDMARPSTVGYCGYHTAASCSGQIVQVAFLWNLDGDAGCSAQDTTTGNSQGLAALVNVTAHEVQETISDPLLNAWFDASNAENGDKCAWSYGHSSVLFGTSKFKVQSQWSNAAYASGKGYKNLSGQAGCIDGF